MTSLLGKWVKKKLLIPIKRKVRKVRAGNGKAWVRVGRKIFHRWETKEEIEAIVSSEGIPTFGWDVPDDVSNITFSRGLSEDAEISMILSIQEAEQRQTREPNDEQMEYIMKQSDNYGAVNPRKETARIENHEIAYYPAGQPAEGGQRGKKPNIFRIKQWVENVKWAGMDDAELKEEWRSMRYGRNPEEEGSLAFKRNTLTRGQRKTLLDSVAYKVARKIWYVGRKPSSMTDWEWNEATKHMRPPAGSFGKGDWMEKHPYDVNYIYESGDV
tara:strand:+ start:556 stop:1368 length:813 start_codon:yes stop_codon:yes gene_type:complete